MRDRIEPGRRSTRVAIIGFGLLAQRYYVPALRRRAPMLDLCVADPLAASRAAAIRALGQIPVYPDYQDLLAERLPDAALVASPPSTHLEIWKALTAESIPVFMEKPFLLPDELEGIDRDDPSWHRLMIDFNRRFWPAYRALGERVADGSLGRVRRARFELHVNAREWSATSDHRVQPGNGGALADLGSQALDLAITTLRRMPDAVLAHRAGTGGFDERVVLELGFGETTVECDLGYGMRNRESACIEGDRATVEIRDPNFLVWVLRRRSSLGRFVRSGADLATFGLRGLLRSRSMLRSSIGKSLASFFDQLDSTEPFSPGFADAYRVARCTRAAAVSIDENRRVFL